MMGNFACVFFLLLLSARFFSSQIKRLSGTSSECQTVWIQIRPDFLLALIWDQTACNSHQQQTKVSRERLKGMMCLPTFQYHKQQQLLHCCHEKNHTWDSFSGNYGQTSETSERPSTPNRSRSTPNPSASGNKQSVHDRQF